MKSRPLLQAVSFGEEVAEFDEHLSQYFVETSSFLDLINDRVDLVLGEKGSGKSAIFRHLADHMAAIPELADTDIVPAFNTQGAPIFRRLGGHKLLTEDAFRIVWFAFVVALLGNHLVHMYAHCVDVKPLRKQLKLAGLNTDSAQARGVWGRLEGVIAELHERLELDGEIELSTPTIPVRSKARFKLGPRRPKEEVIDLEELLRLETQLLEQLDRRAWLPFDRLDEAFPQDRSLEERALHGLLRAHVDLASYGTRVRTKLFLRSDILERVTRTKGFVNATHLRTQRITWDRESIVDLIARRIAASEQIARQYRIEQQQLQTRHGRIKVCHVILPKTVGDQDVFGWMEQRTVDAHRALNPRNVVTLLTLARSAQLQVYDRDDPEHDSQRALIEPAALETGFADLSQQRLEDTVRAEFSALRPTIEQLRSKPVRFGRDDLATYLGLDPNGVHLEQVINDLNYCGLLSTSSQMLTVPMLYRPALRSQLAREPKATTISDEENTGLLKRAEAAAQQALSTGRAVMLDELDVRQRKVVDTYVRTHYDGLTTRMPPSDSYGLKKIQIRPKGRRVRPEAFAEGDAVREQGADSAFDVETRALIIVERLVSEVQNGEAIAISDQLDPRTRRTIERIAQRLVHDTEIRMVAYLQGRSQDDDGGDCVVFAADLPGTSLNDHDTLLAEQPEQLERVRLYVTQVARLVATRGMPAYLRPMSPRTLLGAIDSLTDERGVTYRLLAGQGGVVARLALVPVS